MAIYAKQVAPEFQKSPLYIFDEWPDNVIFDGNRDYKSRTIPVYDYIKDYLNDAGAAYDSANFFYEWAGCGFKRIKLRRPTSTIAEILSDYGFRRPDGKPWTTKQRHEWRLIFDRDIFDDEEATIKALELLTGKQWESKMIVGCCQGEWQTIIFPCNEWSKDDISRLEAEYFNTGTEWIIDDGEFDPNNDSPLNINGCSTYCTSWNESGIKAEIAACAGVSPDEVKLYFFDGYNKIALYREAV